MAGLSANGPTRRTLLSLAAGLPLAAPRMVRAASATTLRFVPVIDLSYLDPIFNNAQVTRNHAFMVFDTLYGMDAKLEIHPQMVQGHQVENNGKLWNLTLREGLQWHDGTKVLGRDCVASIERWAKRDTLGAALIEATDALNAPDDRTIRFRLKRPFPMLPYALGKGAVNMCPMMPEGLARTDPFKQVTEIVGSGPYRFLSSERVPGCWATCAGRACSSGSSW